VNRTPNDRARRRIALLAVLAGALLVLPALPVDAGKGDGGLKLEGLDLKRRSTAATERAVLSSPPEELRSYLSRTAAWIIVADSREDWSRVVTPVLRDGLGRGGSPDLVAEGLGRLPSAVRVSGPDLDGGLVRLDLPSDRGRVYVSYHLPALLKSGRDPGAILNSRRPNEGLFLAGADVRREPKDASGARLTGLYVPALPKGLSRGEPPAMDVRSLPRDGRGSLGVFGGRGGGGEEGELLIEELKRFVGREAMDAAMMRGWPKNGVLQQALRTIRVPTERLVREDDWYKALSLEADSWRFEQAQVRHPARYLAVAAPVVTTLEQDGREERREAIVGLVAFYAPVLLDPEEAAVWTGVEGRRFFEAVQGGEIPFLRVADEVFFYRAHLDRWRDGKAKRGGGKARAFQEARKQAFAWADRIRSRSLDRGARGPLPFRFQPIPQEELEEMVDRRRRFRGRIYRDDLAEWLRHFDRELDVGDLEPVFALAGGGELVQLHGEWASGPSTTAVASRDRAPRTGEVGPDGLKRAPRPSWMEDDEQDGAAGVDEDDGPPESAADDDVDDGGDDFDLDSLGDDWGRQEPVADRSEDPPGMGHGPATMARIHVLDFYTAGACRPGEALDPVVEFTFDGPGDGELGELKVEWDLFVGGTNLRRDAFSVQREAGSHELEFDVVCPDAQGKAELHLLMVYPDRGVEAAAMASATIRGAAVRTWSKLRVPSPKQCLIADFGTESSDDFGIQTARGLESEEISQAVRSFQEETLRCQAEADVAGTVQLEMNVGCDGLVSGVDVVENDTGDPAFAQCVADTMKFCPFPAHAREGGVIFVLPLRFE
jgi:hypothetical protein